MSGWKPKIDIIELAEGQDYVVTRQNPLGFIATGTTAWIEWENGTNWDAVVLGDTVNWTIESDQTDLIPHGTKHKTRISYPDGSVRRDYTWYYGSARRIVDEI